METVILVIHLIIALAIIGLVLIQRSSGGGLGLGGGGNGGMGDFATARGTANTLTRLTTYFAIAFFATSLTLGYIASNPNNDGVLDVLESTIDAQIDTQASDNDVDAPQVPVE